MHSSRRAVLAAAGVDEKLCLPETVTDSVPGRASLLARVWHHTLSVGDFWVRHRLT